MAWDDIQIYELGCLAKPLLIAKGSKGVLACSYLDAGTFNKTGEACAIVSGVKSFGDMLKARVISVSESAEELGVKTGASGEEALEILR